MPSYAVLLPVILVGLFIIMGFRQIYEYQRGVIFRLGKYSGIKSPGLKWIIPFVDQLVKVDLRTIARDVPPQDIITKDNVTVQVNAVVFMRVMQPEKAILEVDNYLYNTSQLAQTTLRSVLGQVELDELLTKREQLNERLQEILDADTDPWGVKVAKVEIKHVDLPAEMQRAMARQAEAERERRGKVIHAAGEYEASKKLAEAAAVIQQEPAALQLRYLQTLMEISSENSSTVVFPIPIEMLKAISGGMGHK
ncbi:MAG: slipin family protein [Deltaproteobacteria bacterium]|nr:MAG: slipin family protein [Deltaproteobacteria bacterium]